MRTETHKTDQRDPAAENTAPQFGHSADGRRLSIAQYEADQVRASGEALVERADEASDLAAVEHLRIAASQQALVELWLRDRGSKARSLAIKSVLNAICVASSCLKNSFTGLLEAAPAIRLGSSYSSCGIGANCAAAADAPLW